MLDAHLEPLRRAVAERGIARAAPAALAIVALVVPASVAWRVPGPPHRIAEACCAYRGVDLAHWQLARLLGGALIVRTPVEWVWTPIAAAVVLAVYEAIAGTRWLVVTALAGHVVPTVLVDLAGAAGHRAAELARLDIGPSGIVVAVAVALAVRRPSAPVTAALAVGLLVDILVAPGLTSIEHLIDVPIGVAAGLLAGGAAAARPARRAARPATRPPAGGDAAARRGGSPGRMACSPPDLRPYRRGLDDASLHHDGGAAGSVRRAR